MNKKPTKPFTLQGLIDSSERDMAKFRAKLLGQPEPRPTETAARARLREWLTEQISDRTAVDVSELTAGATAHFGKKMSQPTVQKIILRIMKDKHGYAIPQGNEVITRAVLDERARALGERWRRNRQSGE